MIKKIVEIKEHIKNEIEDIGGIKIFTLALLLTILFIPFLFVYEVIIKPMYRTIRMMIDAPRLGIKKAHMKYFHSDDYQKEQRKKRA